MQNHVDGTWESLVTSVRWGFGYRAQDQHEENDKSVKPAAAAAATAVVCLPVRTKTPSTDAYVFQAASTRAQTPPPPLPTPKHHPPSDPDAMPPITLPVYPVDDAVAAEFFKPYKVYLEKLRETTLDAMPPPNTKVKAKTHLELVKARLLPIARLMVARLREFEYTDRGAIEMRLCHYIARHYWPLPEDPHRYVPIQTTQPLPNTPPLLRLPKHASLLPPPFFHHVCW